MTAENKQTQPAGETKTIRFEKSARSRGRYLGSFFETTEQLLQRFDAIESVRSDVIYKCLKSFTVTITITEDGE